MAREKNLGVVEKMPKARGCGGDEEYIDLRGDLDSKARLARNPGKLSLSHVGTFKRTAICA
jgi:hypothetical protein